MFSNLTNDSAGNDAKGYGRRPILVLVAGERLPKTMISKKKNRMKKSVRIEGPLKFASPWSRILLTTRVVASTETVLPIPNYNHRVEKVISKEGTVCWHCIALRTFSYFDNRLTLCGSKRAPCVPTP